MEAIILIVACAISAFVGYRFGLKRGTAQAGASVIGGATIRPRTHRS